jgi:hypothetical protein
VKAVSVARGSYPESQAEKALAEPCLRAVAVRDHPNPLYSNEGVSAMSFSQWLRWKGRVSSQVVKGLRKASLARFARPDLELLEARMVLSHLDIISVNGGGDYGYSHTFVAGTEKDNQSISIDHPGSGYIQDRYADLGWELEGQPQQPISESGHLSYWFSLFTAVGHAGGGSSDYTDAGEAYSSADVTVVATIAKDPGEADNGPVTVEAGSYSDSHASASVLLNGEPIANDVPTDAHIGDTLTIKLEAATNASWSTAAEDVGADSYPYCLISISPVYPDFSITNAKNNEGVVWDPQQDGVDVTYSIAPYTSSIPVAGNLHLYWSSEKTSTEGLVTATPPVPVDMSVGTHTLHVPASAFYPTFVFDKHYLMVEGEISSGEPDYSNNTFALPINFPEPTVGIKWDPAIPLMKDSYHVDVTVTNNAPVPLFYTMKMSEKYLDPTPPIQPARSMSVDLGVVLPLTSTTFSLTFEHSWPWMAETNPASDPTSRIYSKLNEKLINEAGKQAANDLIQGGGQALGSVFNVYELVDKLVSGLNVVPSNHVQYLVEVTSGSPTGDPGTPSWYSTTNQYDHCWYYRP